MSVYLISETEGLEQGGKPCVFPFMYNEQLFYGCTYLDFEENERPWCSTAPVFVDGEWAECSSKLHPATTHELHEMSLEFIFVNSILLA